MDDYFELPVKFNDREFMFPAQLHLYGYSQKIEVIVNGVSVMFERDEEREWRAIVDPAEMEKNTSIKADLLMAVAGSIEEVLK